MKAVTKKWYDDNVAKLREDQWQLIIDAARPYMDDVDNMADELGSQGDTSGSTSIVELE
jgi:hypothetical protein